MDGTIIHAVSIMLKSAAGYGLTHFIIESGVFSELSQKLPENCSSP